MKKTVFSNRITSVTVILTLALCIGCGIFGMAKAVDLLSVKADNSSLASPSDNESVEVSSSDNDSEKVSASDVKNGRVAAQRGIVGHLYAYAVPPESAVNFVMTHTVTTDSGKVKTTHTPGDLSGDDGVIYNL